MKMFNLNCPRCGKYFYGDIALVQLKTPVHCPQCQEYIPYEEYEPLLNAGTGGTLARLSRPLTQDNMYDILYIPQQYATPKREGC